MQAKSLGSRVKEGVPFSAADVPEPGRILDAFFKVHRHFCVFVEYSHLSAPVSSPAAACRNEPRGWTVAGRVPDARRFFRSLFPVAA